MIARAAVPSYALNFYTPTVGDQLRSGRKTATIRLGAPFGAAEALEGSTNGSSAV